LEINQLQGEEDCKEEDEFNIIRDKEDWTAAERAL